MVRKMNEKFDELKDQGKVKGDFLLLKYYPNLKKSLDKQMQNEKEEKEIKRKKWEEKRFIEINEIKEKYFPNDEKSIMNWIRNYLLAKDYYDENGHLLPLAGEEITVWNCSFKIYHWVTTQRYLNRMGKLKPNQIMLLNKIKMVWVLEKRPYKDMDQVNEESIKKE